MQNFDGAELRHLALTGDTVTRQQAFSKLWDGFYRRLVHFARGWPAIPNDERADAATEALLAAFAALASYDPTQAFSAWLFGVARHKFQDAARHHHQRQWRQPPLPDDEAEKGAALAWHDDFPERSAAAELAGQCARAIAGLSGRDRRIAQLRFHEELNASQIGQALGLPAATVRWRIAAIRRQIQTQLELLHETA
ncbi:MAG: hypothetical protein A2087_08315 [Spirochaetes bacterium GWD1_61_31]|nr:MAG: hypothetical protein A2Y37_09130 [Spirochaetes bacterium GWB1_60_80]OHD30904.1 MAG: hypothetical protein A2004_07520 [Spirochaetes bacterium GWC1_61_12]OHD41436.1 MAG: hypothetical protein A2087_08315 [Spirochaetes bacterium GWD1_61_31]OHD45214.1 MAG: hypothetical protein A2Y35_11780 [Spirochaetes bacterium GWE1_60_18]OHD60547.1 MAG: hypothetical protein A2Y32_03875 [Spirochaetes bacterium GWF1_60_12]HAW85133.1 hypothetical protein [Spirochaetaceae bacterium]